MSSNVVKLIIWIISQKAIPNGGGFADGIKFWTDAEYRKRIMDESKREADAYIELVKTAPDNPYGNDDEAIASAILDQLKGRVR